MSSSMSNQKKKLTITIEGNIGSGKSTLLSHLAKSSSSTYEIIPEPLESWTNYHGHNLLAMFYDDPSRWAFLFEMNALMTMAGLHVKPTETPIRILERSIYSTRYCFMENLRQSNLLEDVEYHILDDHFKILIANQSCKVDLIVYLQSKPEVCLERIRSRHRSEEASVDLTYLSDLHQRHEEWLISCIHGDTITPPVLIINADQNEEELYTETTTRMNNHISSMK